MNDETAKSIGKLVEGNPPRDAIHVAVIAVEAAHRLWTGAHVGIVDGKASDKLPPIGVVDPFLKEAVNKGEKFWLFLYPLSITSLKHQWTHPDFEDEGVPARERSSAEESERWLRNFIASADCPHYDVVIKACLGEPMENIDPDFYRRAYDNDGEYLTFFGRDAHGDIPPEFWDHVENVTGTKISRRPTAFSCSC